MEAKYYQANNGIELIINLIVGQAIIKVLGHQYWWLAGGYDLEIGHF